uniref:Carbonic anhydrase n=1 Tax=Amphiprion percula TaxID=161767 RepID=A0A3P8TYE9_AMPPE
MTGNHWGYGKEDGPSLWHRNYPVAQGSRQSPIDIIPHQAAHDHSLDAIILNYDHCTSINISNNGHSVVVEFDDSDDRSVIRGGPLDNAYRLKQFHFHWGGKGCHGSEHTVAGMSYASELHLVHWNAVKYKNFSEAATAPDGLVVLGIFLETGDDHRWLHVITDALYMVKYKASTVFEWNCCTGTIFITKYNVQDLLLALLQFCRGCCLCVPVTGQPHRFQRFQPQVPPPQQPPLLDLPGISDHTPPA